MSVSRPRRSAGKLTLSSSRHLLAVAIELLEKLYVHLPLKRSMYAVNPVQRLRLLERRMGDPQKAIPAAQFYAEMLSTFSQLRDLHTAFVMPEPFRSSTVYLPFRIEAYYDGDERKYVVSEVMAEAPTHPRFRRGADITHWNGVPIERAVAANADREPGSNPAARHAQGLASMTIRWLGQSLLPDEDWIDVTYRSSARRPGRPRVARFTWQVFTQEAGGNHLIAHASGHGRSHLGMDARGEVERQVRHQLFAQSHSSALSGRELGLAPAIPSFMQAVFPSVRDVKTPHGKFGYIRIATFNVPDDTQFLEEFIRLAAQVTQDGLILDVRGNRGGLIHAGERLLQLLTPRRIEPCRFHFLNSTRTEAISRRRAFRPWNESIGQAVETGAEYSQGLTLLPEASYNDMGQAYQGPVVLLTDALCYSTTDIFAAGFQDNRIGRIIGVDDCTGAGGANVWEYPLISTLLGERRPFYRDLPGSASFRLAVRRATRVGRSAGVPLEDIGVRPDERHRFTRDDVLKRNVDLIRHAAGLLADMPRQRLTAERSEMGVRVTCSNIDSIDVYLGGRPGSSNKVKSGSVELPLPPRARGRVLRLDGYRKGVHVASTRVRV